MERLRLGTVLPADPATVYECWISAKRHAEMTGASATSDAKKGGAFTAWDGYITGKHLVLEPGKRIVQAWRTTEFPSAAPDSTVEIRLSKVAKGTKLSLLQSDIPDGQSDMYAEGWLEYYFDPMTRYFSEQKKEPAKRPVKKSKRVPKKTAMKRKVPPKKTKKKKAAKRH
ncbi:MAG TPA: SRPBCC domain-containing protein [Polyangiaceae bacterium]|nr:SRPBCC domain-containing protein [Polyangiaceae bacterium]